MKLLHLLMFAANIGLAIFLSHTITEQNETHMHTVHPYDYVLEVDGTDSIEVFHIFDNRHYKVGSFTSTHPDSLVTIIDNDNL